MRRFYVRSVHDVSALHPQAYPRVVHRHAGSLLKESLPAFVRRKAGKKPGTIVTMSAIKALIPGFLLTWIVSSLIGSQGSRGGLLGITHSLYLGHEFYWSWPLFCGATALAWLIFSLLD